MAAPFKFDRIAGPEQPEDLGLLTLVLDDPLAPPVIASWQALAPELADVERVAQQIADIVDAATVDCVRATLSRCLAAKLLLDGSISANASLFLRSHVRTRMLGSNGRARRRSGGDLG